MRSREVVGRGEVVGCPEWVTRFVPSPLSALFPKNAMVNNPHGGPHLLLFVAVYPSAFRPCFGLISSVSNTGCLCLPFSVLVLRGKSIVRVRSDFPQSPVKVISSILVYVISVFLAPNYLQ